MADYEANFQDAADADLQHYAGQPILERAVELAAMAQDADAKRQSHQARRSASTLQLAHSKLAKCDFTLCSTFDELIEMVNDAIGGIHDIGPLTVYDTSRRIGAYVELEPEKVYLHSGTRDGARAIDLGSGRDTLEIDELPIPFRRLTAGEIEDCLCIYKDELKLINGR